jgi:hypothetical protein
LNFIAFAIVSAPLRLEVHPSLNATTTGRR